MIVGTGLEGGTLGPAFAAFSLNLDSCFKEQAYYLNDFTHEDKANLDGVAELMRDAKSLARKVSLLSL